MASASALHSLAVQGIYKDYGQKRALSGVSFAMQSGQITVLLGDNGAGKSTLMNILAGLIRPSRGSVLCDKQPIESLEPTEFRRRLGVLSHEPRCYGDLSPRENLQLFARLYGLARFDAETPYARVERWLETVGLSRSAIAERPARALSRGMLQRLALARTLLHAPDIILLDEPYTGLDQSGAALLSKLLTAERQRGAIIVVISHDLLAAAAVCDKAVVLSRGRVVAEQTFLRGSCSLEALRALYEKDAAPLLAKAVE